MFDPLAVAAPLQAELARLRVDGPLRSVAELTTLVEQCQVIANQAGALQVLAMAHLAAIEDVALEDGTVVEQHRGLGHQRLDAPALVSEQLGLSDAAASSRLGVAVEVATRVPVVLAAMASGRLDAYRAGIVCEELRDAPAEVCHEVGSRIEGALGSEPPALLRRRVRRVLGAVDADLVREKAARARAARSLRRWPGDEPGVDTWMGSFPVEQARSGWAVIDQLARDYVRDGRATGVDEARADALMDLIHSRATGRFVVQLAVPASQLEGRPQGQGGPVAVREDALVTVVGLGMPGATEVRRSWLQSLDPGAGTGTIPTVLACHADSGALLADTTPAKSGRERATESQAYRPPPGLVELVRARDGKCRFPGCTVSAVSCDLDHVRPWPSGPTHASNLMCLCRRHHRVKQSLRWRVRMAPDASVTWTDPVGRQRTTLPIDFLQLGPGGEPPEIHRPGVRQTEPSPAPARADGEPTEPWSTWEDELGHHLARAEGEHRRASHGGRGGGRGVNRRFVVDRGVLGRHDRGRRGAPALRAHDPPPF